MYVFSRCVQLIDCRIIHIWCRGIYLYDNKHGSWWLSLRMTSLFLRTKICTPTWYMNGRYHQLLVRIQNTDSTLDHMQLIYTYIRKFHTTIHYDHSFGRYGWSTGSGDWVTKRTTCRTHAGPPAGILQPDLRLVGGCARESPPINTNSSIGPSQNFTPEMIHITVLGYLCALRTLNV